MICEAIVRVEVAPMRAFLAEMVPQIGALGDGVIEAVDQFCDHAGMVRLVQLEPEGPVLRLLVVPSLRMLGFLERIGAGPWPVYARAFAGFEIPPEMVGAGFGRAV